MKPLRVVLQKFFGHDHNLLASRLRRHAKQPTVCRSHIIELHKCVQCAADIAYTQFLAAIRMITILEKVIPGGLGTGNHGPAATQDYNQKYLPHDRDASKMLGAPYR